MSEEPLPNTVCDVPAVAVQFQDVPAVAVASCEVNRHDISNGSTVLRTFDDTNNRIGRVDVDASTVRERSRYIALIFRVRIWIKLVMPLPIHERPSIWCGLLLPPCFRPMAGDTARAPEKRDYARMCKKRVPELFSRSYLDPLHRNESGCLWCGRCLDLCLSWPRMP